MDKASQDMRENQGIGTKQGRAGSSLEWQTASAWIVARRLGVDC